MVCLNILIAMYGISILQSIENKNIKKDIHERYL